MRAVLLAGGLGTRLRSVVSDVPKPMAPVGGRPFLEHLLDFWIAQGVSEILLNVGHRAEVVSAHFGDAYHGIPVRYVIEEQPLGTGGGLVLSLEAVTGAEPCLFLNANSLIALSLPDLFHAHQTSDADITLAAFPTSARERYGALESNAAGHIVRFAAKGMPQKGQDTFLASAGVYLGSVEAFGALRHDFPVGRRFSLEAEGFPALLTRGLKLRAFTSRAPFLDIGVPEDFARAPAFFDFLARATQDDLQ